MPGENVVDGGLLARGATASRGFAELLMGLRGGRLSAAGEGPPDKRRWARTGVIPAAKLGNRGGFRFRREDLDRFLEGRRPASGAGAC